MNKKGFTLIELLGVIVIIGLIIAGTTYGLIKIIDRSKEEKVGISISSIKETASVYANEKNNDEDYWNEITRTGYEGSYFCVTIEELMNKGLLDKNIDLSDLGDNITKTTYVGIKKDFISKVNSNPTLLNNAKICNLSSNNCSKEDILYGVCTGNIINESITDQISITGGKSYTDEIYGIEFSEIKGENIEIDKSDCHYNTNSSTFPEENEGTIEGNICNIKDLDDNTDYYIRICTYTKGGSSSCATTSIPTKEVPKPTITLSDKVNITYNTDNIKGESYYYFKSTISGTSSIKVSSCTLNNDNTFTCNNDSTTNITKDTWYKSPSTNVSISYNTSGTGVVDARTYDKSNNYNKNSKEFSLYTITYNANGGSLGSVPSTQIKISGTDITLTRFSPSRSGYDFTDWNTDPYGRGTRYTRGAKYSIDADLTLYAQWEEEEEYFTLDYVNAPSSVPWGTSVDFTIHFDVSSNIGITTSDVRIQDRSYDCAIKSSFGPTQNCLNGSWYYHANIVVNAYYYTNNSNVSSANYNTNNGMHCIEYRGYASAYNRYTDNTIEKCYSIVK